MWGRVPTMSVAIVEPVPEALQGLLRRAVLDHATAESRRLYRPVLHVGVPGGSETTFEPGEDEPDDQALRVDVVEAMVRRVGRLPGAPLVWLTRPGPLTTQDLDLRWLSATTTAAGELGVALRMAVVDRRSWRDPRTGVGREWQRLRRRS
jgi:hypothetical protein